MDYHIYSINSSFHSNNFFGFVDKKIKHKHTDIVKKNTQDKNEIDIKNIM